MEINSTIEVMDNKMPFGLTGDGERLNIDASLCFNELWMSELITTKNCSVVDGFSFIFRISQRRLL